MNEATKITMLPLRVAAVVLLFVTLAAWAFSSPVGSSPDEGFHLVSIWCGKTAATPDCETDSADPSAFVVPEMVVHPWACFYGQSAQSAACQRDATANLRTSTADYNHGEYPSGYYTVMRKFVGADVSVSVIWMRLFNVLLAATMVIASASLGGQRGLNPLIAWLAVITPVASFFIASVNPTGWSITGVTCFTLAANYLVRDVQDRKTRLLSVCFLVVSALLAVSSRRDAAAYVALFGFAIVMLGLQGTIKVRERRIRLLVPTTNRLGVAAVSVVSLVSFLLFVRSGTGTIIASGLATKIADRNPLVVFSNNFVELPDFIFGFFAGGQWGLGWFDTPMPELVSLFSLLAGTLVLGWSLIHSTRWVRFAAASLAAIGCTLVLLALQADHQFVGETVQPRYLLPLFLGTTILVAAHATSRLPSWGVALVAFLSVAANSVALRTNIRRYVTGLDVRSLSLESPKEWWWDTGPSPTVVWLVGSVAFACLFGVIITERRFVSTEVARHPLNVD